MREQIPRPQPCAVSNEAAMREIADLAIDVAVSSGATYADCRVVQRGIQAMTVKGGRFAEVSSLEDEGWASGRSSTGHGASPVSTAWTPTVSARRPASPAGSRAPRRGSAASLCVSRLRRSSPAST